MPERMKLRGRKVEKVKRWQRGRDFFFKNERKRTQERGGRGFYEKKGRESSWFPRREKKKCEKYD